MGSKDFWWPLCPKRHETATAVALLSCVILASFAEETTAEGLAAHFSRKDGQLQAISYPGPWDGLSTGTGFTVQAWVHLPDAHEEYTTIFAYGVRNPLNYSVAPSELGLEMRMFSRQEDPVPIINYKGLQMMPIGAGPGGEEPGPSGEDLGEPKEPGRSKSPKGETYPDDGPEGGEQPDGKSSFAAALAKFQDASAGSGGSNPAWSNDGYRVHVTATIDYASGEYAVYVNGTRLYGSIHPPTAGEGPPSPGGELMIGAEFARDSAHRGKLTARRPSYFIIDNFKVFDRALSKEEVAASLSSGAPSRGLILSWDFDVPFGDLEEDRSGNGNHGRRGAIPELTFPHIFGLRDEKLSTTFMVPVVPPRMVMSHAPPNADKPSMLSVALVPPGQDTALDLISPAAAASTGEQEGAFATVVALTDADLGINMAYRNGTSLGIGSRITAADQVVFSAPSEWPVSGETPITFVLSLDGEEKTTEVYQAKPCEPPNREPLYLKDDEWMLLSLGGVCDDGVITQVEIVEAPLGGALFEVLGGYKDVPFISQGGLNDVTAGAVIDGDIVTLTSGVVLRRLTSFPHVLNNGTIHAIFMPALVLMGPTDVHVRYRWLSDYASSSAAAAVKIRVTPRNQPPVIIDPVFSAMKDGGIDLHLRTQDVDGSPAGQDAVIYEVVRGPKFGVIKQVSPGMDGALRLDDELSRFGMDIAKVEKHAAKIPQFDAELGPAWSSQDSECGECCWQQETCTQPICTNEFGQEWERCSDAGNLVDNVLGDSLDHDMISKVFSPHCSQCGSHWFVFGIEEPIYLTEVEIKLFGVRGVVTKIGVSDEYKGLSTPWVNVYQSQGDEAAMQIESVYEYEPPVCKFPALKSRYFRVEYDTDLLRARVGFHAVEVEGSLVPRVDGVWNEDGRLWYQPTPGIYLDEHVVADDFEVKANDCIDWSETVTVKLPAAQLNLTDSSAGFGAPREVSVELGSKAEPFLLDISEAVAHLSAALGSNITAADFTVKLQLPWPTSVALYQHDGSQIRKNGINATSAAAVQLSNWDLGYTIVMPKSGHNKQENLILHFVATAKGVSYHLPVNVVGVCPPDSDPTECATRSRDCVVLGVQAVFNRAELHCEFPNDSLIFRSWFRGFLGFLATLALVLLVSAFYFKNSFRGLPSGPPRQGEKVTLVITDIHGSTSLWDKFPEEMAVDIALHHECLRASLKKCKGYEIATEGDSFKCAFRTPEDAISWSILAQMDLLCAPWREALEDGGHPVLQSKSDWANLERPPLTSAEGCRIIDAITSSEIMEATRASLRKGLVRQPLFSPSKAAATEFSREWAGRKGAETTCVHSSTTAPIPVFRGPRVRMGIHSGIAEHVKIHELTKRRVYSGEVADVAKAVSDAPCGGQIIMSGETLAEVESLQDLQATVANKCAGWRHGEAADDKSMPAAISVFSLGSHIIKQRPEHAEPEESVMLQQGKQGASVAKQSKQPSVALDIDTTPGDICVQSLTDERILPAVGQPIMLKDLKSKLTRARTTLQSMMSVAPTISGLVHHPQKADSSSKRRVSSSTGSTMDSLPELEAYQQGVAFKETDSVPPHSEFSEQLVAEKAMDDDFRWGHELIMVVPWMLKTRAMYYPPPSSIKSLTPSWDMAPAAEGVTIVFTFIESFGKLKAWNQIAENHHGGSGPLDGDLKKLQAVVRYQLVQHSGYEVEGEEGNFVCAFHTPADAVPFAIAIQEALLEVNWSEGLLSTKWCHEQRTANGELSFRGMRLSVGMCTGNALRVQPCVRTGKMEYYGPIMNHAARVATAAHGGQVLMHEATWQALLDNITDYAEEVALFSNMGKHSLKGITKQVYITQAIPKSNQSRAFPPIKTLTTKSDAGLFGNRESTAMELDQYLLGVGAIQAKDVTQPKQSDIKDRSLSGRIAADFQAHASKAMNSFKSALQVRPVTQRLIGAMSISPKSEFGKVAKRAIASRGPSRANMDHQEVSRVSPGVKSLKRAIAKNESNEAAVTDDSETLLAAGRLPPAPAVEAWGGS